MFDVWSEFCKRRGNFATLIIVMASFHEAETRIILNGNIGLKDRTE